MSKRTIQLLLYSTFTVFALSQSPSQRINLLVNNKSVIVYKDYSLLLGPKSGSTLHDLSSKISTETANSYFTTRKKFKLEQISVNTFISFHNLFRDTLINYENWRTKGKKTDTVSYYYKIDKSEYKFEAFPDSLLKFYYNKLKLSNSTFQYPEYWNEFLADQKIQWIIIQAKVIIYHDKPVPTQVEFISPLIVRTEQNMFRVSSDGLIRKICYSCKDSQEKSDRVFANEVFSGPLSKYKLFKERLLYKIDSSLQHFPISATPKHGQEKKDSEFKYQRIKQKSLILNSSIYFEYVEYTIQTFEYSETNKKKFKLFADVELLISVGASNTYTFPDMSQITLYRNKINKIILDNIRVVCNDVNGKVSYQDYIKCSCNN